MKTAELFALSCELAAFLSKATPAQRAALREFGLAFGTAYQIYDDCVDLFGTEAGGQIAGHGSRQGQVDLSGAAGLGARRRDRPRAAGVAGARIGNPGLLQV